MPRESKSGKSARRSRADEYDRADTIANVIIATFMGAMMGSGIGLGLCMYILPTILFAGDTILAGAIICGFCGYKYGDPFIDALRDSVWW